jgi:hypothetical protein
MVMKFQTWQIMQGCSLLVFPDRTVLTSSVFLRAVVGIEESSVGRPLHDAHLTILQCELELQVEARARAAQIAP